MIAVKPTKIVIKKTREIITVISLALLPESRTHTSLNAKLDDELTLFDFQYTRTGSRRLGGRKSISTAHGSSTLAMIRPV